VKLGGAGAGRQSIPSRRASWRCDVPRCQLSRLDSQLLDRAVFSLNFWRSGCITRPLECQHRHQLSQMDPRDALNHAHRDVHRWTIGVIKWRRSSVDRRKYRRSPVYHTERPPWSNDQRAAVKCLRPGVEAKFRSPEGSTFILEIPEFPYNKVKPQCPKPARNVHPIW